MPPIFDEVDIMSGSRPARDMSWRSTTTPRNQLTAAIPNASKKRTIATIHATGLRTTGPHPLSSRALVTPSTFDTS